MNALVAEYDSQAGPRRPVASRMASAGVFPFATPGDLDAAGIGPAAVITELRDSVHAIGALGLCRDELEAALGALSQLRAAVDACEPQFAAEIDRLGDFGDDAAGVLRSQSGCSRAAAKRAAGRAQRRLTIARTADGMIKATALMDPAIGAAFRAVIDDVGAALQPSRSTRPASRRRRAAQLRPVPTRRLGRTRRPRRIPRQPPLPRRGGRPTLAPNYATCGELSLVHRSHANTSPICLPTSPYLRREGDCACDATSPDRRFDAPNAPRRRNQVVIVADVKAVEGDEWARCEIAGTGPIPLRELERLACGADIFGVIFDGDGQPLWHGRRVRTVTDAQWRALVARDRHCVVCEAAPNWCEAHHLVPWRAPHLGSTNIDNLALLCTRCHHKLHDSGLALRRGRRNSCTLVADLMRE